MKNSIVILILLLTVSCGFSGRLPSEIEPLFPPDGSTMNFFDLQLSWRCENADNYEVYFSADSAELEMVSEQTAGVYELEDLDEGTWYYWKVTALNSAGSVETKVLSFKTGNTPQGVTKIYVPKEGQVGYDPDWPFIWAPAEFAEEYEVEVATDTFFAYITLQGTVSDTVYNHSRLDVDTKYYWRIKSVNIFGKSDWCPYHTFTTGRDAP